MRAAIIGVLLLLALPALAHQPVQDMAPRWSGGWGLQVRHEYRASDDLIDGRSDAPNPLGREERVHTTWLEGVYTFRRELRVTAKLPWVDQERVVGTGEKQGARGFGDLTLALPLKRYWNDGPTTRNWSFTPSIRLPTGSTGGDYPIGDGSTDAGVSVSHSRETPRFYQYYDLFFWKNGSGSGNVNRGDVIGLDVNLAIHPLHSNALNAGAFLMWDVSARYEARGRGSSGTTGGKRVSTGPVLVVYWQNVMARAEWKWPAYERVWGAQLSRGTELLVSLAAAF